MHVRKTLVLFLCCFSLIACNRNSNAPATANNAAAPRDMKQDVEKSLAQAGFEHDVNVDLDHDKGVVTLKGRVRSEDLKARAGQVAQQAAPGHVIANELSVEPVDQEKQAKAIESNVDDAIEKNYKASLIANRLDDQHIRFHAKNGVLTLEGRVRDAATRTTAEKLGANVPNVQNVVNKLDVGR